MPGHRGFLLTVEGVDGSGKSTQVRRIVRYLRRHGKTVTVVREPGGTPISERIRRILLDLRSDGMTPPTELFLYLAARAQLMVDVIEPALGRGHVVVADRFSDSTLAYQGGGRGLPQPLLRKLNLLATRGRRPDLTLFIDVPLDVARRRRGVRADRLEKEKRRFRARVRQRFKLLTKEEPRRVVQIDGRGDVAQVWQAIRGVLDKRLKLAP